MELTYTTEKSEKETIKLFLRRRGFLLGLQLPETKPPWITIRKNTPSALTESR